MNPHAIETHDLSRSYKTYQKPQGIGGTLKSFFNRQYREVQALAPTNLQIESGEIIGLVGANGAGKTTLLKLLSGLIFPSKGEIKVLGFIPWQREPNFLRQISLLLGQKNQLWWDIPAADSFNLLSDIYDIPSQVAKTRMMELAERLHCIEQLNTPLRRLSLGERMKMELIGSLLHRPKVLFLDEPTIGLDVVAQERIREFIQEYSKSQKPTIILTSHYMDDIAKLADRLLVIQKGQIIYDGNVKNFVSSAQGKQRLFVRFETVVTKDIRLQDGTMIKAGASHFECELAPKDMGECIKDLLSQVSVSEISLEEADFETAIRQFFEQKQLAAPLALPSGVL